MKRKVYEISKKLSQNISKWDDITAIVLGETADIGVYDPNFLIYIDVYHEGNLPTLNERRDHYKNPAAFETSPVYPIDRFLTNTLPILIHYKKVSKINLLLTRIKNKEWVFRQETTNTLYRIVKGHILFNVNEWIQQIKKEFGNISKGFWLNIIDSSKFFMEHYLMELGVSVINNNHLLYQNSLSNLIQSICSFIFAFNKEFEPSARMLYENIKNLKKLPDEFINRFDGMIKPGNEYSPEKKAEIAKLITKSLISMNPVL